MTKQIMALIIMLSTVSVAAHLSHETMALHFELVTHDHPRITSVTHPILYGLVQELADKAHIAMPSSITLYHVRYLVEERGSYTAMRRIDASIDLFGDNLEICYEMASNLSYEELKGVLAVVIAEEAIKKRRRTIGRGIGTAVAIGATLAIICACKEYYRNECGDALCSEDDDLMHCKGWRTGDTRILAMLAVPSLLMAKLYANRLQEIADKEAVRIVGLQPVIDGIRALERVRTLYTERPLILGRLAEKLKLAALYNMISYPLRSATTQERIEYLEHLSA